MIPAALSWLRQETIGGFIAGSLVLLPIVILANIAGSLVLLSIGILANLAGILITAVPAIYYTTDRCPKPGEIVGILTRKPLRYVQAGFQFAIVITVGLALCIIPGILVSLTTPLYVYYVFTTDLELIDCLSKAFKGMFQDFGYLVVLLLCNLAVIASIFLCFFPCLVVLPMTALYMQNYIHYKGLVRARELA